MDYHITIYNLGDTVAQIETKFGRIDGQNDIVTVQQGDSNIPLIQCSHKIKPVS